MQGDRVRREGQVCKDLNIGLASLTGCSQRKPRVHGMHGLDHEEYVIAAGDYREQRQQKGSENMVRSETEDLHSVRCGLDEICLGAGV
jgi:hypothetical protein